MLHYRAVGEGRPLVIVHGLFGSGDNWWTLAGKFPGYQVFLPDLRNHGESPWFDSFSIADLAADLAEFSQSLGLGTCPWIGHSLGGKAVMELGLTHPELVKGLADLDMAPREGSTRYTGFIHSLRTLDLTKITGRSDAQARLAPLIPDLPTLQFLLKSLVPDTQNTGQWRWRLNLASLEDQYPEIWKGIHPGRSFQGPALFLYGGASDYVSPGDEGDIRRLFPNAKMQAISGAGHWLHAEKPIEVVAALNQWLQQEVP